MRDPFTRVVGSTFLSRQRGNLLLFAEANESFPVYVPDGTGMYRTSFLGWFNGFFRKFFWRSLAMVVITTETYGELIVGWQVVRYRGLYEEWLITVRTMYEDEK